MDTFVKEAKTRSTEKRLSDNLHKANSILSVFAILMTIALFVRIETKTKVIDLQIQQIKDVLKVEKLLKPGCKKTSILPVVSDVGMMRIRKYLKSSLLFI
ncbi:hypothetical protein OS493_036652 [Desmophyllum pertusum]|uniref:Uncharacterized protein n=1 Tax=Desmophyllum pertusum TaxID=174260 RepID=A0A9W9YUU1_9CNID|nr:hypothetical protein OS493_036652 [Desmophyllum pertusum]